MLRRRDQGRLRGIPGARGQSSVEYLLVVLAFLAMALALAGLWHAGRDGALLGMPSGPRRISSEGPTPSGRHATSPCTGYAIAGQATVRPPCCFPP